MVIRKAVLTSAIGTLLAFAAPALAQTGSPMIAKVDGIQSTDNPQTDPLNVAGLLAYYHVPGVSVAVIHDFKIEWVKSWGVADVETGAPATDTTLYQAASISKTVAALGSLKAVDKGYFGLDQDINSILKSWKLPKDAAGGGVVVTPRMLMSHVAGLGDSFGFPGYEPGAPLPTNPQILDGRPPSVLGPVRQVRPAMTHYQYSGGGVQIEQLALADATGIPFEKWMQDNVLGPIGMVHSSFDQPLSPEWQKLTARGHDENGKSMGARWHVYPELAAAGLWTTPTDLANFLIEVQKTLAGKSTRVVSKETMRNMITPVGVGSFAVGFDVKQMGDGWYFSHGGANWGFRAYAIAHYSKGYGVVVMTNSDGGSALAREIVARVGRAYDWDGYGLKVDP